MRYEIAVTAQRSSERVVAYLEEIRSHMGGASPELDARMDEAIAKNRANAERFAEAAAEKADVDRGFTEAMLRVSPAEVGSAWGWRYQRGYPQWKSAGKVNYSRSQLDRLSKRAKLQVYGMLPEAYRIEG